MSSFNVPPTPGAFQTISGGGTDTGVTKLNAAGSALVYSTLLGGSGVDIGRSIAVDADKTTFALRPSSQPPPRTGETIKDSFPPPASTLLPPAANDAGKDLRVLFDREGKRLALSYDKNLWDAADPEHPESIVTPLDPAAYQIDPLLFSPAMVFINNLRTGSSFCFGHTDFDLLAKSFFGG